MRAGIAMGLALVTSACDYSPAPSQGLSSDGPTEDDGPTTPDALVCPASYVELPGAPAGSRYRVSGGPGTSGSPDGRSNWVAAHVDCSDDGTGTHLAIAETEEEYKAFSDAVSGATRWLGVTDRKTEQTWIPIIGGTESDFIGHWFGDSPNGGCCDQTSDCMTLSRSLQNSPLGQISTAEAMPCNDSEPENDKGYICECDGRAVDPGAL